MLSVPMFNLAQVTDVDKLTKISNDVLNSPQHILGPNVHNFEIKFAEYIGVNHCLGVANGSDALVIALRAIGIKKDDEVATVANAGFYTCTALNMIGARPVFIDIDPDSLLIDPIDLEKKLITNNIKAVVVTHLYGQAAPIKEVIELLDKGKIRMAEQTESGWIVNEWLKKAVILYFPIMQMETIEVGPFEFHDKIPLKKNYKELGVRVVPHAIARHGSFVAKGVIMMPSYVNIGAYVDEGTMVDTWATVGSCAQIGKNVHLSGGVGIGGVLEPIQAAPVIIEDNCFIGSRCIVVEGVRVEREAVLGANVVLTMSTKIIDVTQKEPIEYKGVVPSRSVVIPGSYTKEFPAGQYQVPCALIIGTRKESTDKKTSLNDALREHSVAV